MKRTKIVCTIGPASEKQETLVKMIKAGMNVARLNMSHGAYDWHKQAAKNIRAAAKKVGEPVALLLDLQGPKVRVGELGIMNYELRVGERVVFTTGEAPTKKIPIDYPLLHKEIKKGHRILLADGLMECVVEAVQGRDIVARVKTGGVLISHKGINLPDTVISLKTLTPKDKKDLVFGVKQNVDFIAFSFARSAKDVLELRKLIDKAVKSSLHPPLIRQLAEGKRGGFVPIQIIVKIEKHEAVKNFDAILAAADGIMVARGDLALEIDSAKVPLAQKEIIIKCRKAGKPVIVATEMLGSMEKNPRPTRAEISDVANAVIDHTDAVMLSAESAMGKYPVETVATMAKIIKETEASRFDNVAVEEEIKMPVLGDEALLAAVMRARQQKAKAMVIFSPSSREARLLSRFRAEIPIVAGSSRSRAVRQMNLSWGVYPRQAVSGKQLWLEAKHLLKLKGKDEVVVKNNVL
ncbi:MAG: pyruvate kinase [bacterium]|nr:pyruvate kinase [bacterium]